MENLKKEQTLESLFSEIDAVATKLESGDASLEESFQLYKKGMEMLKLCNEKIDEVLSYHLFPEKEDGSDL